MISNTNILSNSGNVESPVFSSLHRVTFELNSITRRYSKNRGIGPISMQLHSGQICSIIGANGSGKTTLLRCICMLEPLDDGNIQINNFGWSSSTFQTKLNSHEKEGLWGIVFQNPEPWPHLSVIDNILLPLIKVAKLSKSEALNRAEETLEVFGLIDRSKSLPLQLSGGLRQRVAQARVFAMRPKVLLLDEPTSALDPEWTEKVGHFLRDYVKQGNLIILVSHQINFVQRISDQVIYLIDGVIAEKGSPHSILQNPQNTSLIKFLENA